MIRTTCSCGKGLKADDKHGGKTVKCPKCGRPVILPYSLDDIPSLVDVPALQPENRARPNNRRSPK